jgi:lysophospholipase L1-like esterase
MRKFLDALKAAWLMLGVTLVLLLLLDFCLRLLLPAAHSGPRISANAKALPREQNPITPGPEYWRDFERARQTAWRPYVYFRRLPYAGTYIHIDANGFRVTPSNPQKTAPQLWFFGGSVMWGTGSKDEGTIPALIASARTDLRALNFAESGYVAQQSHTAFTAALRCEGAVPAAAVFLDGANDVYAALQSGHAGWPQNEGNRAAEFNVSRKPAPLFRALLGQLKGLQALAAKLQTQPALDIDALAKEIARSYLASIEQTRAVAALRRIPVLFLWQPTLFEKAPLSAVEQGLLGNELVQHQNLQMATTAYLRQALLQNPQPDVMVLSDVFKGLNQSVFFDFVHIGQTGNQAIAEPVLAWLKQPGMPEQTSAVLPTAPCENRPTMELK